VVKAACRVPALVGKTLPRARKLLTVRNCRLGRVGKSFSSSKMKDRVIKQRPKPGKRMARNARVNVVLGRGPR